MKHLLLLILFYINATVFAQTDANKTCLTKSDTIDGMQVLEHVEKMPAFPGGQVNLYRYLIQNISYSDSSSKDLQLKINVTFIIDTTGIIRNACIMRPLYPDSLTAIEKEVLKTIERMPIWTVAENHGKKVPVRIKIPINLELK